MWVHDIICLFHHYHVWQLMQEVCSNCGNSVISSCNGGRTKSVAWDEGGKGREEKIHENHLDRIQQRIVIKIYWGEDPVH